MKNLKVFGLFYASVLVLSGCGNSVSHNIKQSIDDNKSAQSLLEWESSSANPEVLFAQWREEFMVDSSQRENLKSSICKELTNLDGNSLTLFENEINDVNNRALVSDCKEELLAKLNEHFEAERSSLSVSLSSGSGPKNSFKFPANVQKRDMSKGYFAVSGDVARKEVVLTFDDGPSDLYTQSILDSLAEVDAKAMFFMLGKNSRLNPNLVRKVAEDGHAVGSHSKTHACLGTSRACAKTNGRNLTFDEAVAEIKSGHQAIYDILGWVEPMFRFPYGEASPELKNFLKNKSTGEFYWNIDSEDWKAQSNAEFLRKTLAQIEARGRGIVLFHDIQRKTAEVMPQFLRELYARGYSVVLLKPADDTAKYNSKLVTKKTP